jgi:hypothetical protein
VSTVTNIQTLNQLVENLRVIASEHLQIHTFYYGDPHEFYLSGTTNSPEMWVACDSINRESGRVNIYNMNIVLADNVKRGEVNELEVESDLIRIAEDVVAYLRHPDYGWNVSESASINFSIRTERTPKNLTTVEFVVPIRVKLPDNRCAIPFTNDPLNSSTYGGSSVSLINIQTGAFIESVPCGNSKYVYQFDTISGGNASTTYTDIIVAN